MSSLNLGHLPPGTKPGRDNRRSHRDLAYGVIRRSILLGHAEHGMPVNERVVAEKLGISRVPVREALLCLHGEGLVSRSKRGMEVTALSPEEAEYQTEFRTIVECAAARLSAERITQPQLDQLYALVDEQEILEHAQETDAFRESDQKFHQLILQSTKNPFIVRLSGTLAMGSQIGDDGREGVAMGHRRIVDALAESDPDKAERLMYEHVTCGPFYAKDDRRDKGA